MESTSNSHNQDIANLDSNQLARYAIAKAERIAQALYVLTNHLGTDEPFRINLRTKALGLIDALYEQQTDSQLKLESISTLLSNKFNELSAVLQVGQTAGLLSVMNFTVLSDEMTNLMSVINDKSNADEQNITTNFFQTTLPEPTQASVPSATEATSPLISNKFSNSSQSDNSPKQGASRISNRQSATSVTVNNAASRRSRGRNHSKRRRAILALFKDKPEITINDVQDVIEGCSQKTMQRELKSLVESDLLEKHGKRRWSSYTLAEDVDLATELG